MTMLPDLARAPDATPRVAVVSDATLVTRVLTDAFVDDPMWGAWAFPRRRDRRDHRAAVFRVFVEGALRYPATWIAPDDAAIAMWIPPASKGITTMQEVRLEADLRHRLGADQAGRIFRAFDLFEAMLPSEPHYYLSLLGTDPVYAGLGIGRRLLAHSLSVIDREGAAAYLDCADDLMPLYERFGFRAIGSVVLPDGPRSNGMWREPR